MSLQFKKMRIKKKPTLLPMPREFEYIKNPSYFNSIVTGCFSPIINLPQILWHSILKPTGLGFWALGSYICLAFYAGVTGNAMGLTVDEVVEEKLTDEEIKSALEEMMQGSGYVPVSIKERYGNAPTPTSEEPQKDERPEHLRPQEIVKRLFQAAEAEGKGD